MDAPKAVGWAATEAAEGGGKAEAGAVEEEPREPWSEPHPKVPDPAPEPKTSEATPVLSSAWAWAWVW
eukprot:3933243-Rhodomonas_salina.1